MKLHTETKKLIENLIHEISEHKTIEKTAANIPIIVESTLQFLVNEKPKNLKSITFTSIDEKTANLFFNELKKINIINK